VSHFDSGGLSVVTNKKPILHRTKVKHVAVEKVEKKTPAKSHVAAHPNATATIDRRASRDRRAATDRRVHSAPVVVERRALERRVKVSRRRQIDPTTCERDYSSDEIEFMGAIDEYKRSSGRMFPTCSEVLEVIKSLGYVKCPKTEAPVLPDADLSATTSSIPTAV
jgi:hypothetical protein